MNNTSFLDTLSERLNEPSCIEAEEREKIVSYSILIGAIATLFIFMI